MRKSNIILWGMFAIAVTMMTVLQSAVYRRDKHNEVEDDSFYKKKNELENYTVQQLGPFTSIKIENSDDVGIAYSSEYKVLIKKNILQRPSIKQEGNELTIHEIDNKNYDYEFSDGGISNKRIIIYCPSFNHIQLYKTSLQIDSFPPTGIVSINLTADKGAFYLGNNFFGIEDYPHGKINFGSLNVMLKGSSKFLFNANCTSKRMQINATNYSSIELRSKDLGDSLQMNIGDSCTIGLLGSIFKKVKN